MKIRQNGLARIPVGFQFHDVPVDPKPGAVDPPAPIVTQEPKSIEERVEELKSKDRTLYDVLFGRGVTKGKSESQVPLTREQLASAEKLFAKVKPEDIDQLLSAREEARTAALEKSKAEQNFTAFSQQMEVDFKAKLESQQQAYDRQLQVMKEQLQTVIAVRDKYREAVQELKITREVVDVAKALGFIDPSDAAVQLVGKLDLNDQLEIVLRSTMEPVKVEDMVAGLAKTKTHLVRSKQKPGTGGTPPVPPEEGGGGGTNEKPTFKRSQLRDNAFYKAHEAEILAASRDHRIIDDVGKNS